MKSARRFGTHMSTIKNDDQLAAADVEPHGGPARCAVVPEYDTESGREIIDLKSLFDTGGVLHIAIDSSPTTQTAQKLGATAGGRCRRYCRSSRYNTEGRGSLVEKHEAGVALL